MAVRNVKLTIFNDLVCAWCYIGQRELDTAIRQCADLPLKFDIEYRPFQVNRALPEQGSVKLEEYYSSRFGTQRWEQLKATVNARAAYNGINFNWGGKISQTTRAHRLIHKAGRIGGQPMQRKLIESFHRALFEEAGDIGDADMLAARAEACGVMTHADALEYLESEEDAAEVARLVNEAIANGVTGAPSTLIDNQFMISGCNTSDVYLQVFRKLAAAHAPEQTTPKQTPQVPLAPVAIAAV
jgi:predicted DsbA family dithiol-disulfide isomerase